MSVNSVEEFLALLDRSGLLTAEQLARARELAPQAGDPTNFARLIAREGLITRWQAGQLLAGRTRLFVGKYKLIQLLGRGGMRSVFLAEHVTMNRRVALKIVSREIGQDPALLQRFLAEARAIAALDHPNIVQAYSVDNEGDRYYIVMEYIDGLDLQRMVESEGALPFDRAADYIRQAAAGLGHAHARKMLHCGLKPSAILVNSQGVVKILDLGIARLAGRSADASEPSGEKEMEAVDYLAPEQTIEGAELDQRTDIYSLGCTLYFLLTGHAPFSGATAAERIAKHRTAEPDGICQQRPDTPPELAAICLKMMAKNAADRYQSAEEVGAALAPWQPPPQAAVPLGTVAQEDSVPNIDLQSEQWWSALPTSTAAAAGAAVKGAEQSEKAPPAKTAPAAGAALVALGSRAIAWLRASPKRLIAVAALAAGMALTLLAVVGGLVFWAFSSSHAPYAPPAQVAKSNEPQKQTDAGESAGKHEPQPQPEPVGEKTPEPKEPPKKEPPAKPTPDAKSQEDLKKKEEERKKKEEEQRKQQEEEERKKKEEAARLQKEKEEAERKKKEQDEAERKKQEEQKKKNAPKPLSSLAGSVELPPLGKESVSFGPIHLEKDAKLDIKLLGGDIFGKTSPHFQLEPAGEAGARTWSVKAAKGKNEPAEIAQLSLSPEQQLLWHWSDEATQSLKPDLLRSCGLLVSAGGEDRFVPLRAAQAVQALAIDFDHGSCAVSLPVKSLPDPTLLRLEITDKDFEGAFPPRQIGVLHDTSKPAAKSPKARPGKSKSHAEAGLEDKLDAGGQSNSIGIKEQLCILLSKQGTPNVELYVKMERQRNAIIVKMTQFCDMSDEMQSQVGKILIPFSEGGITQFVATAAAQRKMYEAKLSRLQGQMKAETQKEIDVIKKVPEKIKALTAAYGDLLKTGKIHFRVFVDVGQQHDVTLFHGSQAAGQSATRGARPGAAGKASGNADSEERIAPAGGGGIAPITPRRGRG
ncbi:MAG: serine/threonine-protein kinase [Thermoguttaceae bacterium]|jgi:serine/threonine protein kinase